MESSPVEPNDDRTPGESALLTPHREPHDQEGPGGGPCSVGHQPDSDTNVIPQKRVQGPLTVDTPASRTCCDVGSVQGAELPPVVHGETGAAARLSANASRCVLSWRSVMIVERSRTGGDTRFCPYLHLLHLLTPHASNTLSEELGQTKGQRLRPNRNLPQEMSAPERALPPTPPHRGQDTPTVS